MVKLLFISSLLLSACTSAAMDKGAREARNFQRVNSFDGLDPESKAELLADEINGYINRGAEVNQQNILYYLHAGADPHLKFSNTIYTDLSCSELISRIRTALRQTQKMLEQMPSQDVDLVQYLEQQHGTDSIENLARAAHKNVDTYKSRLRAQQLCVQRGGLARLDEVESFIDATLQGRSIWQEQHDAFLPEMEQENKTAVKKSDNDDGNVKRDPGRSPGKKKSIISFQKLGKLAIVAAGIYYVFSQATLFHSKKKESKA